MARLANSYPEGDSVWKLSEHLNVTNPDVNAEYTSTQKGAYNG
jgi:hypothetical protein